MYWRDQKLLISPEDFFCFRFYARVQKASPENFFCEFRIFTRFQYTAIRRGKIPTESEVLQMQKEMTDKSRRSLDSEEEFIDILIAISVIAKRLAAKLRQQNMQNGGQNDEQDN